MKLLYVIIGTKVPIYRKRVNVYYDTVIIYKRLQQNATEMKNFKLFRPYTVGRQPTIFQHFCVDDLILQRSKNRLQYSLILVQRM